MLSGFFLNFELQLVLAPLTGHGLFDYFYTTIATCHRKEKCSGFLVLFLGYFR